MSEMMGQDKALGKQLHEIEICNFPEREFITVIVKMVQDLRKRMGKTQEMFTKDLEEPTNREEQ